MHQNNVKNLARRVTSYELWIVGPLVVASLVWSQLLIVVLLAAAGFRAAYWAAYGRISERTPADWGIFLLLGLACISMWVSPLPEKTVPQVLRLLSGAALYYAMVNWVVTVERTDLLVGLLSLAGIVLALFSLISVQWAVDKMRLFPAQIYQRLSVLVSDAVHPNVMAGSLVLFAPIVLSMVIFYRRPPAGEWRRQAIYILSIVAFIVISMVLVLTLSRGAWIAYIFALGILIALRWKWGWIACGLIVVGGLGFAAATGPRGFFETILASQTLDTLSARLETWSRAVYMIQDFPFSGVGMGLFPDVSGLLYPFNIISPDKVSHAHNLFLQVAVDLGLPGLIAWLSALVVMIVISWRLYRAGTRSGDCWAAGLGAGFLLSVVALIVHGMTDAVVWGMVRSAPIVWAVWGAAIACFRVYMPDIARLSTVDG